MAVLSWATLLAGCAKPSLEVPADKLPFLIARYQEHRRMAVFDGTGWVVVTPRQQPKIILYANGLDEPLTTELDDIRMSGDRLVVPGRGSFRAADFESVEIDVESEPDQPPEPARPAPASDEPDFDVDSRRHELGVQAGGSGYFQIAYRFRVYQSLYLDAGAFGMSHNANGSLGLVLDIPLSARWSGYIGSGVGAGMAGGATHPDGCDAVLEECPIVHGFVTTHFIHSRVGIGFRLGAARRHRLGLDVGAWFGEKSETEGDKELSHEPFMWPMAGFSYHYTL